jgi:hypothetical protein
MDTNVIVKLLPKVNSRPPGHPEGRYSMYAVKSESIAVCRLVTEPQHYHVAAFKLSSHTPEEQTTRVRIPTVY